MKTLDQLCTRKTVSPGLPSRLSGANSIGDGGWQGDLGIQIVGAVPKDYKKVENPSDEDRQLVPLDGSPGSHHRIQHWDGVTLYRPSNWGETETDLRGPCVVFDKPNAIVHESGIDNPHGTVFIDDSMTILCHYQRNLDLLEAFERRARD